MPRRVLFLFVEGLDDERFAERVIAPRCKRSVYGDVIVRDYARRPDDDVNELLSVIRAHGGAFDYRLFVDRDYEHYHSDDAVIASLRRRIGAVDPARVYIVRPEIEAWYLAGLDRAACQALGIAYRVQGADAITKEIFDSMRPSRYKRADFMAEILKRFAIAEAKRNNSSFRLFCNENQDIVGSARKRK